MASANLTNPSCIVVDARTPGISGLQLHSALRNAGHDIPILMVTEADLADRTSLPGRKAGAFSLLDAVRSAVEQDAQRRQTMRTIAELKQRYTRLTSREKEVLAFVSNGLMNKQIAWELGITEITVKVHRANAIRKMEAPSLAALVRMLDALQCECARPTERETTSCRTIQRHAA